jgi:hypothetical protein
MAFEASFATAFVDPGTNSLHFVMRDPMTDEQVTVMVAADALRKLGGSDNPLKILELFHTELVISASNKIDANGTRSIAHIDASDLGGE